MMNRPRVFYCIRGGFNPDVGIVGRAVVSRVLIDHLSGSPNLDVLRSYGLCTLTPYDIASNNKIRYRDRHA